MDAILWLQSMMSGAVWDSFWRSWTKVYSIDIILLIIPIIFWVCERRFARQLSTLLVLQLWAVTVCKGLIAVQRPTDVRIRIQAVDVEGIFSRPSGHATGIAALFGALGLEIRRRWFTVIAAIVILMVGISRLYLGVHWPLDIALGWVIGLSLAFGMRFAWSYIESGMQKLHIWWKVALAVVVPFIMLLICVAIPAIARVGLEYVYPALGALSGVWIGSLLEERHVRFNVGGALAWHIAKCIAGLALVFGLRMGLKAVLPEGDLFDYTRYAGIGLFIALGAPWLFSLLPWAPQQRHTDMSA